MSKLYVILSRYRNTIGALILLIFVVMAWKKIVEYDRLIGIQSEHTSLCRDIIDSIDKNVKSIQNDLKYSGHKLKVATSEQERKSGNKPNSQADNSVCPHCVLFDLSRNSSQEFDCVKMTSTPPVQICIYPPEKDIYISNGLKHSGQWEGFEIRLVQSWLQKDKTMGLIDIGSNIGVYTLAVAAMGRKIIAVEPNPEHIARLHRSINIGHFEHQVTLFQNAVSNIRGTVEIIGHPKNQGATVVKQNKDYASSSRNSTDTAKTILLNDIVGYCHFSSAIMKIDVEGFEHRAFASADLLFDQVYIPVVLMEWAAMKNFHEPSEDHALVLKMIDFFSMRNYIPMDHSRNILNTDDWYNGWPRDIFWARRDYKF